MVIVGWAEHGWVVVRERECGVPAVMVAVSTVSSGPRCLSCARWALHAVRVAACRVRGHVWMWPALFPLLPLCLPFVSVSSSFSWLSSSPLGVGGRAGARRAGARVYSSLLCAPAPAAVAAAAFPRPPWAGRQSLRLPRVRCRPVASLFPLLDLWSFCCFCPPLPLHPPL